MSTPIKREDIRKGDKIRETREYISTVEDHVKAYPGYTYELIERPVVLPTVPGVYLSGSDETWRHNGAALFRVRGGEANPSEHAPFTLLRPVAEVAAEVLASVEEMLGYDIDPGSIVAARFGATN